MGDYEIYDLSCGWYDILKENIKVNNGTHKLLAQNVASEETKRIELATIEESEKVLDKIQKYMRGDMTVKIFPRQAHRLFWVLIENCHFYKTELDKAKKKSAARRKALLKIKEAAEANDFEEVRSIIESCSGKDKNKDVSTEADTPDDS